MSKKEKREESIMENFIMYECIDGKINVLKIGTKKEILEELENLPSLFDWLLEYGLVDEYEQYTQSVNDALKSGYLFELIFPDYGYYFLRILDENGIIRNAYKQDGGNIVCDYHSRKSHSESLRETLEKNKKMIAAGNEKEIEKILTEEMEEN